jgi:uncharacterized caspase-like protein
VALFYFSGHGMQVNGRNFLIPIDAEFIDERSAIAETVNLDTILVQMTASARLNLVILDACRTNPFEGSLRGASSGLAV